MTLYSTRQPQEYTLAEMTVIFEFGKTQCIDDHNTEMERINQLKRILARSSSYLCREMRISWSVVHLIKR